MSGPRFATLQPMFGLGLPEIIIIVIAALIFVGPDKLPAFAKSMGKTIRDLRRQTDDFRNVIERDSEIGDAVRELRSAIHDEPSHASKASPQRGFEGKRMDAEKKTGTTDEAAPPKAPAKPALSDDERTVLQAMIDNNADPYPDIDPHHNETAQDTPIIAPAPGTVSRGAKDSGDDD